MKTMPAKWLKEKGTFFQQEITNANVQRGDLIEKVKLVRSMYFKEPGGFDAKEPWEGAADIHLPIVLEKIESAVPKVMSALWRASPFVHVKSPAGAVDGDGMAKVEHFLSWAFRNDIENFYTELEEWLRNMLLDGTAIMKTVWERRWRRGLEIHKVKSVYAAGDVDLLGETVEEDRPKIMREMLGEVFGLEDPHNALTDTKKSGDREFTVQFTEDGRRYEGRVEVHDTDMIDEVELWVFRKIIEYDAPTCTVVALEDFLVPFRTKNVQTAAWVAHKTRYTIEEIERKSRSGEWNLSEDDMRWVKSQGKKGDPESITEAQKDEVTGEGGDTAQARKSKRFDPNSLGVYEIYVREYIDDGEEPVDLVLILPEDLNKVVAVYYQDELVPKGVRPFAVARYIPVPGRIYGMGMAELLYAINYSVDNTISMTHNLMELVVNPFFFYSPFGAATNPDALTGIKPGTGIPTADPNSVKFAEFRQQPLAMLHASFGELLSYADRLTFSPGVTGNNNYRNAPRTARGTMMLMDAAEEHLSTIVEQLQETSWKDLVAQVTAMYGRWTAVDKWYHVTGETSPRRINPKHLRGNLQFAFSGSLTNVNRDIQRALAEKRYAMAGQDPLYNSDPRARQALLRSFLEATTEGDDADKFIPSLPGEGGYDHPPLPQDKENMAMSMGMRVSVLPVDDHAEHLAEIDKFVASDAFKKLPPLYVALIAEHRNAHTAAQSQQIAMQHRAMAVQAGTAPDQQGLPPEQAPQPGAPVSGVPDMAGDMSFLEGGPVG